ncbi:hypothetical protein BGX38DRAFT_1140842 [Terfezia claveryi]|nr:hypothetical protein BGX38DRAFT_1140842 [Terfezia claveryi]
MDEIRQKGRGNKSGQIGSKGNEKTGTIILSRRPINEHNRVEKTKVEKATEDYLDQNEVNDARGSRSSESTQEKVSEDYLGYNDASGSASTDSQDLTAVKIQLTERNRVTGLSSTTTEEE